MIGIIGSGPSGSYLAYLLAKQGHEVSLFEEHSVIGKPIQCTGLVTKALFDLIPYSKEYMVNELKQAEITGPNSSILLDLEEYVICRHKFDAYLANLAENAGAEIHLGHHFTDFKKTTASFKTKEGFVQKKFDILVGADGPLSRVAKSQNIFYSREFYIGVQATMKGEFQHDTFTANFGSLAPGFFAWSVPESDSLSRVGLATKKNAREHYNKFIKSLKGNVLDVLAGPIPHYTPKQIVGKDNIFLVGDAAGLAKATTGGGIITGMLSSKILADCIINGKSYEKEINALKKELWIHMKIRQCLDKFQDKDYDYLISLMNNKKVRKILFENPREYPSRFVAKLFFSEPRLFYFLKFLPLPFC